MYNMSANITIPNTLTIFINTRIRGYPKIKYSPSMTVPRTKSETVYFDPLVKLNSSVINYIPAGHPPSEKFTQFFNKNEFTGLVNRTISSTHQKKIGLVEATNAGYVDNNIELILNTLFSSNGPFYIRDQPFTIYSKSWSEGDWRIDTKKFESRLSYSTYGMGMGSTMPQIQQTDAESQLIAFKKTYPSDILNGYSTGEKYSNFVDNVAKGTNGTGLGSGLGSGLGTGLGTGTGTRLGLGTGTVVTPEEQKKSQEIQQNNYLNYLNTNIPNSFYSLVGRDIVEQNAINVNTNIRNIPSDPMSLSILYSINQNYSDDIQLDPVVLQPLYDSYINAGLAYNEANNKFTKVMGMQLPTITVPNINATQNSIPIPSGDQDDINIENVKNTMEQKKQYDDASTKLYDLIVQYKQENYSLDKIFGTVNLKEELTGAINTIIDYRKQFIKVMLITMKLLMNKINKMGIYITKMVQFFQGLRDIKLNNLIKQGLTTEEFSFQSYLINLLFNFDINCYQVLFQNQNIIQYISNLKNVIKRVGVEIDKNLLIQINFKEELIKYYTYPQLLLIKKNEFDIYVYIVIDKNEKFESIVWESIKNSSVIFLESVKNDTSQKITEIQRRVNTFNHTYSQADKNAMYSFLANQGENIPIKALETLFFDSRQTKSVKSALSYYLKLENIIIWTYDLITLYSRISVIVFAREIAYVTSQKNLNKVLIKKYGEYGAQNYYDLIADDISVISILNQSPPLFWNIPDYSNITILAKIAQNNAMLETEEETQVQLDSTMVTLEKKYTTGLDLLIPQISALGMQQQCIQIRTPTPVPIVPPPIDNRKKNFLVYRNSKYNNTVTNEFRQQLAAFYSDGINDTVLDPIKENDLDNMLYEWELFGDSSPENSLFTCITIALNTGLVSENSTTNNTYSENGLYSTTSLRAAVAENITTDEINYLLREGAATVNYESNDQERIPYNFLFNENNVFIGADEALVRAAIRLEPNQGGKYYGNSITISILENVFKVKFITLQRLDFQSKSELLHNGDFVTFRNTYGAEISGTIISRTGNARNARNSGNTRNGNNQYNYGVLLDDYTVDRITDDQITDIKTPNYTTICGESLQNLNSANEFTHYTILIEDENNGPIINYYVAFNSKIKNCIFTAKPPSVSGFVAAAGAAPPVAPALNELPLYIYYIIFKGCFRSRILVPNNNDFAVDNKNLWYFQNIQFRQIITVLYNKFNIMIEKKRQRALLLQSRNQRGGSSKTPALTVPNKNLYMDINNMGILNSDYGDSKLSYYVVIDLELYPGNSIPIGEKAVLGCQSRYEKIRQAYAQLFGIQYQPNEFSRAGFVAPNANAKQKNKK